MATPKIILRTAGAAIALALLASACSSDSDGDTAVEASPESTSAAETSTPTDEATSLPSDEPTSEPTEAASPEPTEEPTPEASVNLPDYPLFDESVIAADQELLDALATDYVAEVGTEAASMERFLFGAVPVEVFDRIFSGADPEEVPSLLWLMHLSGYFGGRWLRGEIAEAQPDALLVGFSQEPTAESFGATMASAQVALDAATGSDEAALTYSAGSLPNQPPAEEGGEEVQGLTDNFGYNQGYMLEILATPPEGVEANPIYEIDCSPGLFDCEYVTPRLAVLGELADLQATIAAGEDPYSELVAELLPVQEAAIPRGRGVWSGGLSVQGFSQESYDQLLDVSSSFLETIQATALTMAQATAEGDADQARIGALANAAIIVWLDAYLAGLTNGEGEIVVPEFA